MFIKSLYKLDLNSRCRIWTIEVEKNRYRTISGLVDGEKVTSDWSYAYGKNEGRSNATTDEEQAMRVADTLIRIRKEQGCSERIEDAGKGKSWFQPMLAARWDNVKDKITVDKQHCVYVQRKLDGCRNILSINGQQTRTGKEWVATPHIYEKMKPVFDKYPEAMFDGELYMFSREDNFNEIVSLIKKTKPTAEDLEKSAQVGYWIYDLPSCPGNFSERNAELLRLQKEFPDVFDDKLIVVLPTVKVTSKDMIQDCLVEYVEEGYEGAIVRLDAPYECKRSKNLLKVKQFCDEEFKIVDVEEGRGNLAGKAGRIVVDVDGNRVACGLKFSRTEAQEIWEHRNQYIGKEATVKYFNKTVDGSLRFPKVIKLCRNEYE